MSSKRNHRSSSGESTRDYVDYRHYTPGGMRDRDSRDSHHGVGEKQKSVPGLISDPNSNLQDIDRAIQHGQQESILRSQSSRSGVGVRATQDVLKEYRPTIPSVTHSYYRPSLRNSFYKSINPARINPGFLSFLPGLAGLGLLTAAIVLVAWTFETNSLDPTTQAIERGLFQRCNYSNNTRTCEFLTQLSRDIFDDNELVENLGQAARGLIVIAAAISLLTNVVCVVLGINRCARKKGTLIVGALFALAGACASAGMACYTKFLVDVISYQTGKTITPGHSVYLGWSGTLCLLIASGTSFLAYCARPK